MEKGTSMVNHINYIKTLSEHLEAIEDPILEKDLVIILISSLPEEYNYLITALETIADDKLTWEYVRDRLIHEADKLSKSQNESESKSNEHDALMTDKSERTFDKRNMKCHFCKKKGHFARDCFKKKNATKRNEAVGNYINAEENSNQDADNHVIALKSDESLNDSDNNDWWIDSGASQHMTPTKTHMNNYAKFNKPLIVKLADDTILHAIGKGNIRLKIRRGENVVELLLSDVLHVPKIKNNLFSIPVVINKGASISFENEYCLISKGDKTFKIGSKSGKLYKLDISQEETCSLSKANPNTIGLWHLRFGHLGYDNVNKLISKSMVEGIDINPNEQFDKNCDGGVFETK